MTTINGQFPLQITASKWQSGLEIYDLEEFMTNPTFRSALHSKHDIFVVAWLLNGEGIYCLYEDQVNLLGNCLPVKGYIFLFSADFICSLKSDINILLHSGLFNIYQPHPVPIPLENADEIEQLLRSMIREYMAATDLKTEVLQSLLKVLIIKLSRKTGTYLAPGPSVHGDIKIFRAFQELVHTHFIKMKKVSEYARALGVAPNYLNIKVKRISGLTASHYIRRRILQEAKRQAGWEGMNLKQIAYRLGFDDVSHFSRFFKKTAGINFSDYVKAQPSN